MKPQRSPLALVVALMFVVAVLVSAWSLLNDDDSREATAKSRLRPAAEASQAAAAILEEAPSPEARSLADEADSLDGARDGSFDLTDAVLVRGRILLPKGATIDPSLELIAIEVPSEVHALHGDLSNLQRLMERDGARFSRQPLDGSLQFELPVPRDAPQVGLFLDGRFLYLEDAVLVTPSKLPSALVLQPALGSCVAVQAALSSTASDVPLDEIDILLDLLNMQAVQRDFERATIHRLVSADASGRGEVRALPAGARIEVNGNHPSFVAGATAIARLEAGRVHQCAVHLTLGAEIVGLVLDEQLRPVAEAFIDLRSKRTEETRDGRDTVDGAVTDRAGRFTASGLHLGTWELDVNAQDFLPGHLGELELTAQGETLEVEITLRSGESLSGVVRWPEGKPAADCEVSVLELGGAKRFRKTETDERGHFRIAGLAVGAHELRAFALPPNSTPSVASSVGRDARAWSARLMDLQPSADDLKVVLAPPLSLQGRLLDDRNQPITSKARIEATPLDSHLELSTERMLVAIEDTDGQFELHGLSPGQWKITASAPGYLADGNRFYFDSPFGDRVELPSADPIEIHLTRAARVHGQVTDPFGQPVAHAQINVLDGSQSRMDAAKNEKVHSNEAGAFLLENVRSGTLQVFATHDEWASSLPLGAELKPGTELADVVLVLRQGGTLTGEAFNSDGTPAAQRNVQVAPIGEGLWSGGDLVSTDAAGRFEVLHVDPGGYQVMLEPTREEQAALDEGNAGPAEAIKILKLAGAEIVDGETTHVLLGAPPSSPVRVFGLVTQHGEPIDGGTLFAFPEGNQILASFKPAEIASDGRYEFTLDQPGDYLLFLEGGSKLTDMEFFETIPKVAEYELDLALPTGGIAGRVLGPGGKPIKGVTVSVERDDGFRSALILDGISERTGEDGSFVFEGLAPATYSVRAGGSEGPGSFGVVVVSSLIVAEDEVLSGIELRVRAPGHVSGTVRTADGKPVAGASIFVRNNAGQLLASIAQVTSDAAGKFQLEDIAPGQVSISARTASSATGAPVQTEVSTRQLAKVVRAPAEMSTRQQFEVELILEPGTILNVTAERESGTPQRLRLRVLDERGHDHASMLNANAREAVLASGFSTSDRTVGPLPPGKYTVRAVAADGSDASKTIKLTGQPSRRLKLRLR